MQPKEQLIQCKDGTCFLVRAYMTVDVHIVDTRILTSAFHNIEEDMFKLYWEE